MTLTPQIVMDKTIRRIRHVQEVTIAWMIGEAAVALLAAWHARSPALLAFGGDSAVELLSAAVVLWLTPAFTQTCSTPDSPTFPSRAPATMP
jgi:hypothetical protein